MGKKIIFLVEDDQAIRELVTYILESAGYEVTSAGSIQEFHEVFDVDNPPDGLLLDIMLPDGSGLEICEEVKSKDGTRNVPVMMMSAHANVVEVMNYCSAEVFIGKPFDIDKFISTVNSTVQ